jgi:hypothetical protein
LAIEAGSLAFVASVVVLDVDIDGDGDVNMPGRR